MKKMLKNCMYAMLLAVFMISAGAEPSYAAAIKFAQFSDVHYSEDRDDTSYKLLSHTKEILDDAIEQVNRRKGIKFVMLTGDNIDEPKKRSLDGMLDSLNKLKYPWYIALGNHDTSFSSYINKENFFKEIRAKNKNFKFEGSRYTFKPQKGFRVIVMDGSSNMGHSAHGSYTEEDLEWLDNTLAESKNDVVLIFQHFPVIPPYDAPSHEIRNAEAYKEILKKHKMPIALFSGHYHAARITKEGNILHVSSPALVSWPNSFRIIEIDSSRNKAVFKFEFCETGLKELQSTAKSRIAGDKIFYGREQDRNIKITIEKKQI